MRAIKKIIIILALPALAFFAMLPAIAVADEDAFTIRNIEIAHSGADTAVSKAKAIEAGEEQGFRILLQNLGVQAAVTGENNEPAPEQLATLVKSYQLQNEKTTSESYSAVLTVSFDPELVRSILKKRNISFQENMGLQPFLVIPVLYHEGKTLLWEPENIWRGAVAKAAAQSHSVSLVVPLGDSENIAILSAKDIDAGNIPAFSALAAKYGVKNIMLLEAWNDGGKELTVSSTIIKDNVRQKQQSFKFPQTEDASITMKNAAGGIVADMGKDKQKTDKPEVLVNQPVVPVRVEFHDIAEWLAIKDKLQKMDFIRKAEIKELSGNSAGIDVYYQASIPDLPAAFSNYGMRLVHDDKGIWVLSNSGKNPLPVGNVTGETIPSAASRSPSALSPEARAAELKRSETP